MFSRASLKFKMMFLVLSLCFLSVLVGGFSFWGSRDVAEHYDGVAERVLPKVIALDQMYLAYKEERVALRTLGMASLPPDGAEKAIASVRTAVETYDKWDKAYNQHEFLPGEKELYDGLQVSWKAFNELGADIIKTYSAAKPEDKEKLLDMFFKAGPERAKDVLAKIEPLTEFHHKHAKEWTEEAQASSARTNQGIALVVGVGLLCGLAVGFGFSTSISKTIVKITDELESGAEQVSSASSQIASTSQDLSQASSTQAASLEETVATVEELTSMVKLNSDNAKEAAKLSGAARDIATKGEKEIQVLVTSIQEIASDSKKIEEIINVIDDIAFQTNLLALNAAVEAARAGEQGKGFAVVAEAVRNLAQRSASAAKDINDLIKGSVEKIENGSYQAAQGGVVLTEIVNSVRRVADLNNEIATASDEQSNGIIQIGKVMNNLDSITQKNAAAAEESAAASEELSAQAMTLKSGLISLSNVVEGAGAQKHAA